MIQQIVFGLACAMLGGLISIGLYACFIVSKDNKDDEN